MISRKIPLSFLILCFGFDATFAQGAFSQGFQMGVNAFDSTQRLKQMKDREEQEKKEFEARQEERQRVDSVLKQQAEAGGEMAKQGGVSKILSRREENRLLMNLAIAQRNSALIRELMEQDRGIAYVDAYMQAKRKWEAMDEAEKSKLVDAFTQEAGVRSYGAWVKGPGKLDCYAQFVPGNGENFNIGPHYAGELFAIKSLVDIDANKAMEAHAKIVSNIRNSQQMDFDAKRIMAESCVAALSKTPLRR